MCLCAQVHVRACVGTTHRPSEAQCGSKFARIFFAAIISTLLHNHKISTTYKLTLTHGHTVLPLQLHNPWILGIEWPCFISSLLPTGSCAVRWGHYKAGHKHSLGIILDTIVKTHRVWMRMTAKGDPRAVTILLWGGCRAFVLFLFWVVLPRWFVQRCIEENREQRSWMMPVCVGVWVQAGIIISSMPGWGEWPQCYLWSTACLR